MAEVLNIPVARIVPDPTNLRQMFDEAEIEALAENLVEVGQMDPVQVFERGDGTYDLFDGERRWRASKLAGLTTLKALVIERPSDTDLLLKKVSRVMQTKTLSFQEQIHALEEGLQALGARDDESHWPLAAKRLGVPTTVLRERMRVSRLAPELRNQFEQGKLDYTIAQSLGRVESKEKQQSLAKFIEESKLSNRFVTTGLIPTVLENPEKTPIEVYTLARQRERFRYAEPRKEEIPATIVDKVDDVLADIHRVQGWLETISRDRMFEELAESPLHSRRLWMGIHRLRAMLDSFIRFQEGGAEAEWVSPQALPIGDDLGKTNDQ